MSESRITSVWLKRASFALISFIILFAHLLPLNTDTSAWAMPNFLMAFAFAWSIRRPEYVPTLLLAAILLLSDFLLQRPPGLWALLVLLCCENLKMRSQSQRAETFATEMLAISAMIVGASIAYRVILSIFVLDLPSFELHLIQTIMTIVVYPVAVIISHSVLGVRKVLPGDLETLGRHL